ncbi:hypothetical protein CP532_3011 [Ophiocordyceps camponoti-leonardi (nom. inval.)]|nr:hypothetical protein CP532_3011 [Ophiocordyceps camponoti-leonardi (nom. inval.)]
MSGGPGGGPGGGPRPRRQPQYIPQYSHQGHHHHHPQMGPMYPNYLPYGPHGYYGVPPHQFQNGGMPSPAYHMAYQGYGRTSQYVPMVGVSVPPSYPSRPSQQSPSLSTSYQPPPAPASIPPQTPSSTHSSQMIHPPTPPTPQTVDYLSSAQLESPLEQREPFCPPLPWYSCPEPNFPSRTPRSKRRRKPLTADGITVSLPLEQHGSLTEHGSNEPSSVSRSSETSPNDPAKTGPPTPQVDLPRPSGATVADTVPTTADRPAAPALPLPAVPRPLSKPSSADKAIDAKKQAADTSRDSASEDPGSSAATIDTPDSGAAASPAVSPPPLRPAPTSWANLFSKPSVKEPSHVAVPNGSNPINGSALSNATAHVPGGNFPKPNANLLAEAIRAYRVGGIDSVSFLEPRGLINTGNMCYMNSVLQVLIYCTPFHDFLDQVSKRAAHSFKSETPLIDAMFVHQPAWQACGG